MMIGIKKMSRDNRHPAEIAMEEEVNEEAYEYVKYLIETCDVFEDSPPEEISQLHEIMEIGIKFYIYALRRKLRQVHGNDTEH